VTMNDQTICKRQDLVVNSGVCALLDNKGIEQQVALFFLPKTEKKIYAIGNWDPLGNANVLSRGIVGDINNELVVASPLYKQHFSLETGVCLEDESVKVPVFNVRLVDDDVVIAA